MANKRVGYKGVSAIDCSAAWKNSNTIWLSRFSVTGKFHKKGKRNSVLDALGKELLRFLKII